MIATMRRLARYALTILSALSLLLAAAIVAVYVRAFVTRDELHTSILRHDCLMATFPHHAHVLLAEHAAAAAYPTSVTFGLAQYPSRWKYFMFRRSTTGLYSEISIPFWLPLLASLSIPLWHAGFAIKRKVRCAAGLCPNCGYDLRASPERCPECGIPCDAHRAA